jgi:hypothetical protein
MAQRPQQRQGDQEHHDRPKQGQRADDLSVDDSAKMFGQGFQNCAALVRGT